ncbi:hypothetical protein DXG01_008658 [Tephrocybe rancida]|nr:hypothetical protein DXG01_008658 [Tephrocybe rancida]
MYARNHPENNKNAWHTVIRSTANKKYIPYAPKATLFPPIVTLPIPADPAASTIPVPVAETVADTDNPSVPVATATPSVVVPRPTPTPVASSNTTLVASSNQIPVTARTPVADSTPAPVAGPTQTSAPGKPSAPIPPSSAKVRMAMITPAGHPGHGPSAAKKKAPGMIPAEIPKVAGSKVVTGAKKVQQVPADKVKGQAGKQKPNLEEDGWYINSVHAVPCPNCVSHNQECEQCVGKDNKLGAYVVCFWAKMQCPHSMKGKGKKGEEATSDAPRKVKAKPKCKAPKSPEYMSDDNDNEESPARPAPPQKPACVILPANPVRVVMEEDVAAACAIANGSNKVETRPSNNPLLAAALKACVTLPSHTLPPGPHHEKEVDWYEEMVQYINNVNTGNVEYQQRISSAIGRLSAIVDVLPNGALALAEIRDLMSCILDFEDSTDIGFKRLKEHISKHHERCDHTSAHVTDLEEHIQKHKIL